MLEYSHNYFKKSRILFQFCRDVQAVDDDDGEITDFTEASTTTDSFNYKVKLTGQTGNNGTKNVEIMVPLRYLSNFWRTLEIPLINCKITLDLSWSGNCVIVATNVVAQAATFSITDKKLYVPVVTLSTQDNAKLLEQLKSGFKIAINWNKCQTKVAKERENRYLDFLIDPTFQGVHRLFVLPFENEAQRTSYRRYYLPTEEIKNYNVMRDGQNFFDQPIRNNLITYDNIRKISTGQGDDYTTGCLLDYIYSKTFYKIIATALDVDNMHLMLIQKQHNKLNLLEI